MIMMMTLTPVPVLSMRLQLISPGLITSTRWRIGSPVLMVLSLKLLRLTSLPPSDSLHQSEVSTAAS